MPVTPLPPSNTERWFLDYTVMDVEHVFIMRAADVLPDADATEAFDTILTILAPNLITLIPVGLRHAAAGSDLTFPASMTGLAASYGAETETPINIPLQSTFTGRSPDGRKARVGFFGWAGQNDASWRYTTAEDAVVAAAVSSLNSLSGSGRFVSISGAAVTYHPYMNVGYNDHWVKEARG